MWTFLDFSWSFFNLRSLRWSISNVTTNIEEVWIKNHIFMDDLSKWNNKAQLGDDFVNLVNSLCRKISLEWQISLCESTVIENLAMSSDVLASKFVFKYFQVMGLHSSNEKKCQNRCYQIFLLALLIINSVVENYDRFTVLEGINTLNIVGCLESISTHELTARSST